MKKIKIKIKPPVQFPAVQADDHFSIINDIYLFRVVPGFGLYWYCPGHCGIAGPFRGSIYITPGIYNIAS